MAGAIDPIVPPFAGATDWKLEGHSWQTRRTTCRVSIRALDEPCGWWHAMQPSSFTGACSYTNGPALSPWHFMQPGSLALTVCSMRGSNVPCGLWQSTHDIAPCGSLCVY